MQKQTFKFLIEKLIDIALMELPELAEYEKRVFGSFCDGDLECESKQKYLLKAIEARRKDIQQLSVG